MTAPRDDRLKRPSRDTRRMCQHPVAHIAVTSVLVELGRLAVMGVCGVCRAHVSLSSDRLRAGDL